jgi:signal transduction histidine kinase/CheY-like chemotaxis protein
MTDLPASSQRADQIFDGVMDRIYRRTDRIFAGLLICEWFFAIGCALVVSPRTWEGAIGKTHVHLYAALLLGGAIISLPIALVLLRPGAVVTRHVIAVAQMLMSALLIHLAGGRIETHFHVFGSLAFIAFYRDWRVLVSATIIVAADHMIRGLFWPQSVYGVTTASEWRWIEHAAWVLFEDAFLAHSCLRGLAETRDLSVRQADLERFNEQIEQTVRRRTAELRQAQEQLLQSQKLEAVGKLASGIAHDFNNMLGGILAYSSMLREDYAKDEHLAEHLRLIEVSAERGADMTGKLLAFARKGNYEHRQIDLAVSFQEAVGLIKPTLDKKISVVTGVDEDVWPVNGDSTQILQTVMNLCMNARDAMPGGGELRLEVRNVTADAELSRAEKLPGPGRYVRLSVTDTGCGIPPELHEKVFEPFFTTKGVGKGTGLGLSMVYGIMQSHGGQVFLSSAPGEGTAIQLYFPASAEPRSVQPAPAEPMQARPTGGARLSGLRILVADDEEIMRTAAKAILERQGATVTTAIDGEKAVRIFEADPSRFDAVVLDVIMPGMDGIEAFTRMHALRPKLRFVLISGYAESARISELRRRHGAGFIRKPFRSEILIRELDQQEAA